MKLNKGLKIASIIFECSFIGSVMLYIYNYYNASKKYEILPIEVKSRLNVFIYLAIFSFIIFLIIKYVLYLRNNTKKEDTQLQMNLEDKKENKYKNLEAPVTERVFFYKNEYEVPKERQTICENCGNVVDKNAFICIKCGCLLKEMPKERVIERIIKTEVKKEKKNISNTQIMNILINTGLIIAIIIFIVLIINLAMQRGII